MSELERHSYDVLVIGAGGAGLRAAVEAREAGLRVAIICKSLFVFDQFQGFHMSPLTHFHHIGALLKVITYR